jgi:hypothetical protein
VIVKENIPYSATTNLLDKLILPIINITQICHLIKPPSDSNPVARVLNSSIMILRQAVNFICCAMMSMT